MRIVAGAFKGRRLQGPASDAVRPTSDRLRETLFNVLGPAVRGARVVDGFAGTGAVGLEALSRGAAQVTFIERDRAAWTVIDANVHKCGGGDACVMRRTDFLRTKGDGDADLVFVDPPYNEGDLEAVLTVAATYVTHHGLVVLEHRRSRESPDGLSGQTSLQRVRLLESGDSALSFYRVPAPEEA